jgi:hypothetical protein
MIRNQGHGNAHGAHPRGDDGREERGPINEPYLATPIKTIRRYTPPATRTRAPEQVLLRSVGHVVLLRGSIGSQPQRDVRRLHRLSHHSHQIVGQRVEVGLIAQPSVEC